MESSVCPKARKYVEREYEVLSFSSASCVYSVRDMMHEVSARDTALRIENPKIRHINSHGQSVISKLSLNYSLEGQNNGEGEDSGFAS